MRAEVKLNKRPTRNTLKMSWGKSLTNPKEATLKAAFGVDIRTSEIAILHDGLTEKLKELEKLGYDLDTFKLVIKKKQLFS